MGNWSDRRYLILGAARQGLALARWLSVRGAIVTVSDVQSETDLSNAQAALSGISVRWVLGGHPIDLLDTTDVLCLSGGVPVDIPIVQEAIKRGIPLSNDTQIFMEAVPCKTIGVTGSAGKTTTTALVGDMAKAAFQVSNDSTRIHEGQSPESTRKAFVGGNIGEPLISHVDKMQPSDLAILEISSFQLEQMRLSPNVAAVLNITPNHLDRHHTLAAYAAAKARILEFQGTEDTAVLGRDDDGAWNLRHMVKGGLQYFGLHRGDPGVDGSFCEDGVLYLCDRGVEIPLLRRDRVPLRGEHNTLNLLAAFAIGHAAGLPLDAMLTAAEAFGGIAHRLQLVRELRGIRWVDDSIATAPERVAAAIRSFNEPLILLLGGRDKKLPWAELAELIHQRVDHVILFGEASALIGSALLEAKAGNSLSRGPDRREPGSESACSVDKVSNLRQAIHKAAEIAEAGDVVLLSPGGTSYDEFKDFEERGVRFQQWVQELS